MSDDDASPKKTSRPPAPRPSLIPQPVNEELEDKLEQARSGGRLDKDDVTGVLNLALEKFETATEHSAQARKRGLRRSAHTLKLLLPLDDSEDGRLGNDDVTEPDSDEDELAEAYEELEDTKR